MPNTRQLLYEEAAIVVCLVNGSTCRIKRALYNFHYMSDLRKIYAISSRAIKSVDLINAILDKSKLAVKFTSKQPSKQHLHASHVDSQSKPCVKCRFTVYISCLLLAANATRRDDRSFMLGEMSSLTGDESVFARLRHSYKAVERKRSVATAATTSSSSSDCGQTKLPCYVRVNRLKSDIDSVISNLELEGYEFIEHACPFSYTDFLHSIRQLKPPQFLRDYHLADDLLVFPPNSDLRVSTLYERKEIILQDKASCLPAKVLNPSNDGKGDVLDACAAPGNKTLQIASMLGSQSTLFAIDRDPSRFAVLCQQLRQSGVNNLTCPNNPSPSPSPNKASSSSSSSTGSFIFPFTRPKQPSVEAINTDFLTINPRDEKFARVKSILLDPSCSGTGLSNRSSTIISPPDTERLKRLANLQAMMLKHALSFPSVERLVYSTCSILPQENEHVVNEIASSPIGQQFDLESIWSSSTKGAEHPVWINRGLTSDNVDESLATKCIRSTPKHDLTNGFFVACFTRKKSTVEPSSSLSEVVAAPEVDGGEASGSDCKTKRRRTSKRRRSGKAKKNKKRKRKTT